MRHVRRNWALREGSGSRSPIMCFGSVTKRNRKILLRISGGRERKAGGGSERAILAVAARYERVVYFGNDSVSPASWSRKLEDLPPALRLQDRGLDAQRLAGMAGWLNEVLASWKKYTLRKRATEPSTKVFKTQRGDSVQRRGLDWIGSLKDTAHIVCARCEVCENLRAALQ